MFHIIEQPALQINTHSSLTPGALAALPHAEQVQILQRDLVEMWRAHNHNAQVISTLTHSLARMEEENAQLRRHLADAARWAEVKLDEGS